MKKIILGFLASVSLIIGAPFAALAAPSQTTWTVSDGDFDGRYDVIANYNIPSAYAYYILVKENSCASGEYYAGANFPAQNPNFLIYTDYFSTTPMTDGTYYAYISPHNDNAYSSANPCATNLPLYQSSGVAYIIFDWDSTMTTAVPVTDYSLPIDPSDFSTTTSLFDHDSVSSQMTRYDGTIFYGDDADINHCMDAQGCYSGHHGIDFGTNAEGKNILAAASGTVATLGWQNPNHNEGYGYYMRIYHPQFDQSTIYAHATTTASFFSVNDTVNRGDTILLSGKTGAATGPHLHFGVTIGNTVDPNETIDPFGWTGTSTDPRTNDKGYLWRTNPPSL